jgi:periplasmic protein TonB
MHMILNMRLFRVLSLLACTFATVAGIQAEVLDTGILSVGSSAAQMPHPKQVGGPVSAPVLIHVVSMPGLAHMDAGLVLKLWVETDGSPSHIRVLQGGDPAQNEKIIASVSQYRFAPAIENGKPVLVEMNLELSVD